MGIRTLGAAAGLLFTVGTIAGNKMTDLGDASGDSAGVALANIQRVHTAVNHAVRRNNFVMALDGVPVALTALHGGAIRWLTSSCPGTLTTRHCG